MLTNKRPVVVGRVAVDSESVDPKVLAHWNISAAPLNVIEARNLPVGFVAHPKTSLERVAANRRSYSLSPRVHSDEADPRGFIKGTRSRPRDDFRITPKSDQVRMNQKAATRGALAELSGRTRTVDPLLMWEVSRPPIYQLPVKQRLWRPEHGKQANFITKGGRYGFEGQLSRDGARSNRRRRACGARRGSSRHQERGGIRRLHRARGS